MVAGFGSSSGSGSRSEIALAQNGRGLNANGGSEGGGGGDTAGRAAADHALISPSAQPRHQHVQYKRLLVFRLTRPGGAAASSSSSPSLSSKNADAAVDDDDEEAGSREEALYCMEATCPHLGAPLSHAQVVDGGGEGAAMVDIEDIMVDDGTSSGCAPSSSSAAAASGPTIVCPWHLYDFDMRSGESTTGMRLCTYPVRVSSSMAADDDRREVFVGVDADAEERGGVTVPAAAASSWEVAELKPISEAFGASCSSSSSQAERATGSSSSPSAASAPSATPLPALPSTLVSAALLVLQTADPAHKVELTRQAAVALRTGSGFTSIRPTAGDRKRSEALFGRHGRPEAGVQVRPPEPGADEDRRVRLPGSGNGATAVEEEEERHFVPGRHLEVVAPANKASSVERRGRAGSARNRAAMLHALAAIEQWAIDLAWDAIARFGDVRVPNVRTGELDALPSEFFLDFARMAEDEAKHFSLLSQRLDELGVPFGSLPAHAGLWDSAIETSRSLLSRLAVIHLVAEARGLDVNPLTIEKFRRAGDDTSVQSLEIIHADEVTHVTTGHRWFVWICERMGLDPVEAFRAEVKANFGGKVAGPFNKEDRRKAGMTEAYYEGIEGGRGSQQQAANKQREKQAVNGAQESQDGAGPSQAPIVAPTPVKPANGQASPPSPGAPALPHPSPVPFPASSEILPSTVPEDANAHCPGVESTDAGKADACEGCPNQATCAEGPKGPDPDLPFIRERMQGVRRKILVLSGKGGVGKSTFSAGLSWALAADEELQTGVMDVDVCGPSIPLLMGLEGATIHTSASGWSPAYARENLAVMSIGFMLPSKSDAVIWRGPRKNGLIKQFLKDVEWGDLDYLVVDTPPGTSDEHLSIVQFLQEAGIDGAVLVTTPQEVALQDVRKEADFCRKVGLRVLGVVENMSGFVCPSCKETSEIFAPTTGGAERMAQELGLELLGRVPLDPRIGASCDRGESFLDEYPESPATGAYLDIVQRESHRGPAGRPVSSCVRPADTR